MAKQVLTRLGDFSAMSEEDDDLVSNIRALGNLFVSIGNVFVFLKVYKYFLSTYLNPICSIHSYHPLLFCLIFSALCCYSTAMSLFFNVLLV